MHALEYCITDVTSARAVARALGRNYILVGFGTSWDDFPDRVELKISKHETIFIDKTSKLLLLCPCDDCMTRHKRVVETYKCT